MIKNRLIQSTVTTLFAALLVLVVLQLPRDPGGLTGIVGAHMELSGVEYQVTAVLLNFRGYDTWLEVGVFLVALLAILVLHRSYELEPGVRISAVSPLLSWVDHVLVPTAVLATGYLLWQAKLAPGGAFQAGALLGAALVLLWLGGYPSVALLQGWRLRLAILTGFLTFLLVAVGTSATGQLLQYPPELAGTLILLVEMAVLLATALTFALLYMRVDPGGAEVRPADPSQEAQS